MSIVFDQVDGVVQKSEAGTPAEGASAGATEAAAPQRPAAEQFEEVHRRMEWINRRLHAD